MEYERIEINPLVMQGKPVIRGTSISVELLLRKLGEGVTEAALLAEHPRLTHADIQAALAYAARSISHNESDFSKAEVLNLGGEDIHDDDLEKLRRYPFLKSLSLGSNVTDAGLVHLCGLTQLQTLDLSYAQVKGPGLEHLKHLTHLERIELKGNRIGDTGLEHLQALSELRTLYLTGSLISDAGLEKLRGMTQLQGLSLFSCQNITDAGLPYLKNLAQLRWLNIGMTNISDAGLPNLTALTQLQWLNLDYTGVSEFGLETLKDMKQLRKLTLKETKLQEASVGALQQNLPTCKIEWSPPREMIGE